MPHTDKWDKAGIYSEALAFTAPLKVCEFGKQEGMFDVDKSFIEIEGENLILSSVTKSDNDTVLVRLYNPTEETIEGKLNIGFDFKEAYSVKLDGRKNESLKVNSNTVELSVQKGKIYTVELI
jgi:alpha-mannosidase